MKIIHVVFLLLLCCGCNHHSPSQHSISNENTNNTFVNTSSNNSKDTMIISSWYVQGCAERAAKSDTKKSFDQDVNDLPNLMYPLDNYIKSKKDSIVYNRYEEHLCCRQIKLSIQRQDNVITITEYWFRQGCKCKCNSMVHATIKDLPEGVYQVYAVVTGTDPFDDKPTNINDTVMNQKVSVGKIY